VSSLAGRLEAGRPRGRGIDERREIAWIEGRGRFFAATSLTV
jgi:hypothetical protein